jgi:amino acid transporter
MAAAAAPASTVPDGTEPGRKGLKTGALGYASNVVIGVASTAPAYSLAATLGFVVAVTGVGLHAPAVLVVSFLPMLCIAVGYNYMNRADPDCGTSFAWVTRAMGPHLGWLTGWAIVAADVIVMASLAQIAGLYTFLLFGWHAAASSTVAVAIVGALWIAVMTWICVVGIELSALTQRFLLSAEILILAIFAVVALITVWTSNPVGSVDPSLSWLNPFDIGVGPLLDGVLLGVFIYWGWDSGVAVNEESRDSARGPGKAAVVSTFILLFTYVIVAFAAQSYGGAKLLIDNQDDVLSALGGQVFGSPFDKLLILAVLTSASASTQTTILPTARTSLSMARWKAIPDTFGEVSSRFKTPVVSTVAMGAVSLVWYVAVVLLSQNVLGDSVSAIGFQICFYYGLTGLACAIYYRKALLRNVKTFVLVGVLPVAGFLMLLVVFIKAAHDYSQAGFNYSNPVLGIQTPILIGIGGLVLGAVLMLFAWGHHRTFFRRRPEAAAANALELPPAHDAVATEADAPGGAA